MREILFRGQRIDNGEWVEGYYAVIETPLSKDGKPEKHLICNGTNVFNYEVSPETIGQYTGLQDKNGKKVFEGDILPIYEQGEEYNYKVIYNGDCFMLAMLDSEQGSYPLSIKNTISEVIGNIHDNPELLKGATEDA